MKVSLYILIVFLFNCSRSSTPTDEINYRKLVDNEAKFLGKGLKVGPADKKWDWLLPDLNSTAQRSAVNYKNPATKNSAKYLRSFEIHTDIGFVWTWKNQGVDIYLIYTFLGTNGYIKRVLHNTHNLTLDEVILINYFDHDFFEINWIEQWELYGLEDEYDIESIGFLSQEMFAQRPDFKLFDGRIITVPWSHVKFEHHNYHLCENSYNDNECYQLPKSFSDLISANNLVDDVQDNRFLYYLLKVKFGKNRQIKQVLAGNIIEQKDDEDRHQVLLEWSIPDGELGAGSLPFYIEGE